MLEQLLGRFGESPSSLKEMVMKLTGNLQSMFHASASDEVLENLFALYAFEHFEQASYLSLIATAEEGGEAEVASTCRTILQSGCPLLAPPRGLASVPRHGAGRCPHSPSVAELSQPSRRRLPRTRAALKVLGLQ